MPPLTRSAIKAKKAAGEPETAAPAPAPAPTAPEYEFGGPAGAVGVMVGLPLVIFGLYVGCSAEYCLPHPALDWRAPPAQLAASLAAALGGLWEWEAVAVACGWMAFQAALERLLPGATAEGSLLADRKTRLPYVVNGHLAFWVSLLVLLHGWPRFADDGAFAGLGMAPLEWGYAHYLPLATASTALSAALSVYLYARSFAAGATLAEGGDTGNAVYDFFIGRELNPRFSAPGFETFDLKYFCELRPGLIGWLVLDVGMACAQLERTGAVSYSMTCVVAFHGLYVWDALFHEKAILTTMDITTDGFGFMLAFGDLAWVPFTYTLQARYLVDHDPDLSGAAVLAVVALHAVGYWTFRGANSQKDAFRTDPLAPAVAHLEYLPTERGTKLLTSGWWGAARKINYAGDWLMGLSWCLLCGAGSVLPYFYAIYFGVLLVHRAIRDDGMCAAKYGKDWEKYKAKVPYVFVPGVF